MVDDSIRGFSDERGPQELNERRLKENSSFCLVVLTEDFMTTKPFVWSAMLLLMKFRGRRQQQNHEHVDALLVHKLVRKILCHHELPDSFANLMFGFEFHFRRNELVELPAQVLAEGPEHWFVQGILLDFPVVNPNCFWIRRLLFLFNNEEFRSLYVGRLFFWLGLFFVRVWWLSHIINWDVQIKLPKLSHLKEMGIHFEFHDLNFILIWCKRSGLKFETSTEVFKAVLTFTVAVLAEHQTFGGWFLLSRH